MPKAQDRLAGLVRQNQNSGSAGRTLQWQGSKAIFAEPDGQRFVDGSVSLSADRGAPDAAGPVSAGKLSNLAQPAGPSAEAEQPGSADRSTKG